ncbi:MAG TPA: hypothetical protein VNE62_03185, partial [Actinomycetota bacterium]|nr:hypothetical protein [Actinomycetota bacterium]
MREAVRGEQAMGCPDRGLLGGFSASVLRHLHADRKAGGAARSWAMAALASYGLKNAADREEACLRLSLLVPSSPPPSGGSASLQDPVETLPGVGPKVAAKMHSMGL